MQVDAISLKCCAPVLVIKTIRRAQFEPYPTLHRKPHNIWPNPFKQHKNVFFPTVSAQTTYTHHHYATSSLLLSGTRHMTTLSVAVSAFSKHACNIGAVFFFFFSNCPPQIRLTYVAPMESKQAGFWVISSVYQKASLGGVVLHSVEADGSNPVRCSYWLCVLHKYATLFVQFRFPA